MRYAEKFQKYLEGKLSEEERAKIEEEVERHEVLTEYTDRKLDDFLFEEEEETPEYGKFQRAVSKELNRKLLRYVCVFTIVLVFAIEALIRGLSPLMDALYYSPLKEGEEFQKTMRIYRELFFGAKDHMVEEGTGIRSEGYGTYSLKLTAEDGEKEYAYLLTLKRNRIENMYFGLEQEEWFDNGLSDEMFLHTAKDNSYAGSLAVETQGKEQVRAAISFQKMKTVAEMKDFMETYAGDYRYAALDAGEGCFIGYDPQDSENAAEEQVLAKVKYMAEQTEFNEVFSNDVDEQQAYHYMKENGVGIYGAVVLMTPEQLARIAASEEVAGICIIE